MRKQGDEFTDEFRLEVLRKRAERENGGCYFKKSHFDRKHLPRKGLRYILRASYESINICGQWGSCVGCSQNTRVDTMDATTGERAVGG